MLKNAESFQRCYIGNQNLMGFTEKQSVNDHGKDKGAWTHLYWELVNHMAQTSSSLKQATFSTCLWLQRISSGPTDFQARNWTRFSAATTVTLCTLTMALTRLLYLVSAICWGSFKWSVLQETIAFKNYRLRSPCNAHLFTEFNTLRLLQMGALIGPVFISASLWGSFNEEVNYRQDSTSFLWNFIFQCN